MAATFDRLKAATRLREEGGFSEKQATELVATFADGFVENLATKDGVALLRGDVDHLRADMEKMERSLHGDMEKMASGPRPPTGCHARLRSGVRSWVPPVRAEPTDVDGQGRTASLALARSATLRLP